ncbi:DUF2497 domain-containing protein [Rhizobiaceae bacterium n13]|uniref:DUF2497 domain-containing protein n=1 Tax=Ferirhizobium litorale TaxID=2927786 RepID=A0AAE3QGX5_9HYPH|nr:DUF2497 domain-containing protein [Fererhizobium litorale]MDI7863343.1 DUF2497 domain-containing protein [Fererhizobium litorale]MDI7922923.1 DUF2497 domain-containing protein [Fererhizobium litorale]
MAQPNAAREPSMEEILASIRRIIESNEPPTPAKLAPVAAVAPLEPEYQDDDSEIHLTVDDEIMAAELATAVNVGNPSEALPPVSRAEVDDKDRALSLADVAARVRAASERTASQLRQSEPALARPATRAESPVVTSRMAELRTTTPTAAAAKRVANDPGVASLEISSLAEQLSLDEEIAAIELDTSPVAGLPVAAGPESANRQPAALGERVTASLLSPEAGEQVSRSFGALAAAVDVKLSRPVDEIAEEMLRPMLQDWLDDNLPTLVERLVREEIERVARGPHR